MGEAAFPLQTAVTLVGGAPPTAAFPLPPWEDERESIDAGLFQASPSSSLSSPPSSSSQTGWLRDSSASRRSCTAWRQTAGVSGWREDSGVGEGCSFMASGSFNGCEYSFPAWGEGEACWPRFKGARSRRRQSCSQENET